MVRPVGGKEGAEAFLSRKRSWAAGDLGVRLAELTDNALAPASRRVHFGACALSAYLPTHLMPINPDAKLLDTTLRDGSYAIHFQFSASDTAVLVGELDQQGVEYIEVGHGVGFRGAEKGHGEALETDEAYIEAAASAIKRGRFGMFCIPGIAELEDLEMAASYGMGFVRVGTDVAKVASARLFIEKARDLGMYVMANFMKSYALEPAQFAEQAKLAQSFGAQLVYVVDSAGGMVPDEVSAYMRAVQDVCDLPLGFHGHDNLGLAVGNSLRALEEGAAIVDGSLQGLGRSAGNAPTELLVILMQKLGLLENLDAVAIMDVGEKYIRPLVRRRGLSSLDVVCGEAQFHSSYMGVIARASGHHRVDPRRLIQALTKIDKVNAPAELVDRLAAGMERKDSGVFTARFEFDEYFGAEQGGRS